MRQIRLPDKLSDLLELAVADCLEIEAGGKHVLHMEHWLERVNSHCVCCMAGAVMLRSGQPERGHVSPPEYPEDQKKKLFAIDNMRLGYLPNALYLANAPALTTTQNSTVAAVTALIRGHYSEDEDPDDDKGRAPWPIYLEAADMLRQAGL